MSSFFPCWPTFAAVRGVPMGHGLWDSTGTIPAHQGLKSSPGFVHQALHQPPTTPPPKNDGQAAWVRVPDSLIEFPGLEVDVTHDDGFFDGDLIK